MICSKIFKQTKQKKRAQKIFKKVPNKIWCNVPLNGYTRVLFEDMLSNFTQQSCPLPPVQTVQSMNGGTLSFWMSTAHNFEKFEIFTCHLFTQMALSKLTCKVCTLCLLHVSVRVEECVISPYSLQWETIILPLKAILAVEMYVYHLGCMPPGCSFGWITACWRVQKCIG